MENNPTSEQLLSLMSRRSSARDKTEIPVPLEILVELQDHVLPKIPSAGNLRIFTLGMSVQDRIQIIATPLHPHVERYGAASSKRLLDQEAGTLAAYINLYLLTKGYQTRYYFHNTPDGLNVRLILELAIYPKD